MTKKLHDYTKEELIELIQSLKKTKKFGLVWEDKPEQVAIDCQTKLPVLQEVTDRAITKADDQPTNLIIEGDNYHSLSTLNYTHAGKIDVIYIDPPYNKDKDFIYNDHYVDKEDAYRHSKWLSFMHKRLVLAKSLMSDHGVIFISIDDIEVAHLRLLCDQIFSPGNFEGHIHWRRRHNQPNDKTKMIGLVAEHILVYAKNSQKLKAYGVGKLPLTGKFSNPDNDPRGDWNSKPWKIGTNQSGSVYAITKPNGKVINGQWMGDKKKYEALLADNRIIFPRGGDGLPRKKIFRFEREDEGQSATNWFPNDLFGSNQSATDELKDIFEGESVFENPKPTTLISRLIELGCISKTATILDFFAGSGTTAHSVMKLNSENKDSHRKFILCTNNENNIAENITYQRVKKVIEGYAGTNGIPANVRYFKTDFVDQAENTDQTRVALVARATDMIKIRENTFDTELEKPLYKVYSSAETYSAIIFDPSVIDEAKSSLNKLSPDKPINAYVFSLANDSFDSDFADMNRTIHLCPIPESILEVYKRIFTEGGKK